MLAAAVVMASTRLSVPRSPSTVITKPKSHHADPAEEKPEKEAEEHSPGDRVLEAKIDAALARTDVRRDNAERQPPSGDGHGNGESIARFSTFADFR